MGFLLRRVLYVEWRMTDDEQAAFLLQGTFFRAEVDGESQTQGREPDHQLCWCKKEDAISKLARQSQKWAVSLAG